MQFLKNSIWVLLCFLGAFPSWAAETVEIHGVKFDTAAAAGGRTLVLNGAGTRYKETFKLYAAGLYLERKADMALDVLAQTGPKRMSLTMLRDISGDEMGKLFTKGIEKAVTQSTASTANLVPGLIKMAQIFTSRKQLSSGDTVVLEWLPAVGTRVLINDKVQGATFKEPEFFNALLSIWLGEQPVDYRLKDALLGGM